MCREGGWGNVCPHAGFPTPNPLFRCFIGFSRPPPTLGGYQVGKQASKLLRVHNVTLNPKGMFSARAAILVWIVAKFTMVNCATTVAVTRPALITTAVVVRRRLIVARVLSCTMAAPDTVIAVVRIWRGVIVIMTCPR